MILCLDYGILLVFLANVQTLGKDIHQGVADVSRGGREFKICSASGWSLPERYWEGLGVGGNNVLILAFIAMVKC